LTRPTRPSASAFLSGGTSSDTCHNSAAFCIIEPVTETNSPIQSAEIAVLKRDDGLAGDHRGCWSIVRRNLPGVILKPFA
jgi:hypothetical protein